MARNYTLWRWTGLIFLLLATLAYLLSTNGKALLLLLPAIVCECIGWYMVLGQNSGQVRPDERR